SGRRGVGDRGRHVRPPRPGAARRVPVRRHAVQRLRGAGSMRRDVAVMTHDHVHPHDHGHEHGDHHHHDHGHDHHRGPAVPVLDIGGEVGAVIVYLAADTATGELEMCPTGDVDGRFHTGVHPRDLGGSTVFVAVYPEVAAGRYDLLDDDLRAAA